MPLTQDELWKKKGCKSCGSENVAFRIEDSQTLQHAYYTCKDCKAVWMMQDRTNTYPYWIQVEPK